MLINHPTDGATCVFCVQLRSGDGVALLLTLSLTVGVVGLTLRGGGGGWGRLLGRICIKKIS